MQGAEVLAVVLNESDPIAVSGSIRRAYKHCARTRRALVIEATAINLSTATTRKLIADALSDEARCLAVAIVVNRESLGAARSIAKDMANQGMVLGAFTRRDAATHHALRERSLSLSDPACSSASKVCRVKSINE